MKWRTNMKFCDMPYQRIDFAEAKKELNAYLDNITAAKTLDHILQENQNTRNDERRENSSEKDYPAYGDGSRKDGALGTGILSARSLLQQYRENPAELLDSIDQTVTRAMRWRQAALERDEDPVVVDEYYYQSSDRVTVRRSRNKYPSAKK